MPTDFIFIPKIMLDLMLMALETDNNLVVTYLKYAINCHFSNRFTQEQESIDCGLTSW